MLGRRDYSDVVQQFRLTVTKIVPDNGIGRFGLHPQQHLPMNAFIAMPALQKALGIPHKVNALLVGNRKFEQNASADLQGVLSQAWKLSDLGLIVDQQKNYFAIESSQFILSPNITTVIEELATEQNLLSLPVMTYLANQMTTNNQIIKLSISHHHYGKPPRIKLNDKFIIPTRVLNPHSHYIDTQSLN